VFFAASLCGVVLLHFSSTTPLLLCAGLFIGLAFGGEAEIGSYFVSRYFGLRAFAGIYAVIFGLFTASALGPYWMGLSFDDFGSYRWGLIGLEAALVLSVTCIALLGPYTYGVDALTSTDEPDVGREIRVPLRSV
jgi:MFS family permease